ncbi:MAG: SET domain-containing protein-lysine N-methyltransferase [Candidatus Promineifilaceae bacterium]
MIRTMESIEVRESPLHGLGVFAKIAIGEGDIVTHIDDGRIVSPEYPIRPKDGEKTYHFYYLEGEMIVLMQLPERHVNHCCVPNTFVKTIAGARYKVALRDILLDDEISNDYCINGGGDTRWYCDCGHEKYRRKIHSDFFHLPIALQMEYLPLIDNWFVYEYQVKVDRLRQAGGSSLEYSS